MLQIILWDANTWKLLDRLSGHTLTVTQVYLSLFYFRFSGLLFKMFLQIAKNEFKPFFKF